MNHQLQLENKKYRNWVKAGLGLKYLKEGLEPFSDDIVKQQHVDILNSVKQTCNVTTVNCGNCNLKTLMPNHVRISSGNCPLGQANCNCLYPRGKIVCPNNVCGAIYDTIVTVHNSRPPAPFWKNTDVKKWCTDPWAVAKCFINAQGYAQKTSAVEIDCSGLLHVIINNKGLHSHIQCIISGNDVFCKTRQARNAIFHSVTMELEDSEVNDYIDDMIAILEDGKELHARPESVEAVKKLQEIKNGAFIITKETERDVIRAAQLAFDQKGKELEQKIATAIASIDMKSKEGTESREKAKAEFLETSRSAEKKLDNKTKIAIEKIQSCETSFLQKTKNSTDNLQNITEESIDQIKTAGEATIRKIRDAIRLPTIKEATSLKQTQEKKSGVRFESMTSMIQQQKHETTYETLYQREQSIPQQYGEDYERKKRALQEHLVDLYRRYYLNLSSSPLNCHEDDVEIHEVYVTPRMEIQKLSGSKIMNEQLISSYRNIFYDDRNEIMKNIYILGEVGTGKSSFCKMMMHNWCKAMTQGRDKHSEETGEPNNIETMKRFDFLFFLSLRHLSGYSDNLFEMITLSFQHILDKEFLKEILDTESQLCLILADGLDEWTPPKGPMLPHISHRNPSRDHLKNATIITMSRPSARGILNLKSSECDLKINLLGVEENSMILLIEKYMKKMQVKDETTANFTEIISEENFRHLETMPMMLQHILWVYCNKGEIAKTRSEIYSSTVNILLRWSEEKNEPFPTNHTTADLPKCLKRYRACNENKYFIYVLGKLAFSTILSTTGSSVSFGRSKLKDIGLTKDQVTAIVNIGLLTEEKSYDSTDETTRFAFSHTSFLEFFAAVYIAMNADEASQISALDVLFDACTCVADILRNGDLIKMICGLSPIIICEITIKIQNIANNDFAFIEYRKEMKKPQLFYFSEKNLPEKLQHLVSACLSDSLMNDATAVNVARVNLADVYIDKRIADTFLQQLDPDHVILLYVYSLFNEDRRLNETTLNIITRFHLLQSLHIDYVSLLHEHCDILFKFLSDTTTLSHVILHEVKCKQKSCSQHALDFSRHADLNTFCLHFNESFILTGLNTSNLESCVLHSITGFSHFLINAPKLKYLTLSGSPGKYLVLDKEILSMVKTLKELVHFEQHFTVHR